MKNNMKLNLEKKTIAVVIMFAVFCLGIIFGIIWPAVAKIRELNKQTGEIRAYLEQKYENTKNMRASKQKIEEIKIAAAEYPNFLFKTGNELSLITTMEDIAAKNKIKQKIENSNIDKITDQQIKISLNIEGTYLNVLNYLTDIENLNYFLNVRQLNFTPGAGATDKNSPASLRLDLSLFVNQ